MIEIIILCIFLIFIAILIVRAMLNKPKKTKNIATKGGYADLDKNIIAKHLSEAIQIPTVTCLNESFPKEPFLSYHKFLENTYPEVFKLAKVEIVNVLSLIISIEGSDKNLLPIAILAHQDVVPAPKDGWDEEPFGGIIKDNFVYGRGSLDMKNQMIASLEALEYLLEKGMTPKRGIYFCFGHDEENTGVLGAKRIAKTLEDRGIKFEFVFDEGGVVLDGKIIGVKGFVALIGTSEKGYMDVQLKAKVAGGHASSPTRETAVALLCNAVSKLNKKPMRAYFSQPTKEMFKHLAPHMNPVFKFMFTNRDVLSPLILKILGIASPLTNSLTRTTFAPTELMGSLAPNVLPKEATCTINCRINVGETGEVVLKHIKHIVGKNIEVTLLSDIHNPTPCSDTTSAAYKVLNDTIKETFENFVPAPYPFIAATDAKHYYNLSNNVYRFSPFMMEESDRVRIHALNERIDIDNLKKGTEFFINLLEKSLK